jgi:hypothetical protein
MKRWKLSPGFWKIRWEQEMKVKENDLKTFLSLKLLLSSFKCPDFR